MGGPDCMKFTAQEFAYILSALQVVERDQVAERRHSRIEISGTLTVVDVASNTVYTALARDICFTGLSLLQAAPPTLGAQVVVTLPHQKNRPYRIRCTIANVRELAEQLYCVGCVFVAAEPATSAPA
jgi:hypothetical protein